MNVVGDHPNAILIIMAPLWLPVISLQKTRDHIKHALMGCMWSNKEVEDLALEKAGLLFACLEVEDDQILPRHFSLDHGLCFLLLLLHLLRREHHSVNLEGFR